MSSGSTASVNNAGMLGAGRAGATEQCVVHVGPKRHDACSRRRRPDVTQQLLEASEIDDDRTRLTRRVRFEREDDVGYRARQP